MDFYEHIDDYKSGRLAGDLLQAFEQAMESDASLRAAVDNYDVARDISEGLLEVDMMETIEKLSKKNESSMSSDNDMGGPDIPQAKTFNIRKWASAAVAVGVLSVAGWWMLNKSDGPSKDQIWADNYVRPVDQDATKSVDTIGMDAFQKGKYFFALNRFEDSERVFSDIIGETSNPDTISKTYFWLGHTFMNREEWDAALAAFSQSQEEGVKEMVDLVGEMR